ncbi:MAG: Ig-like domain-containing protein [Rufibacter sp.]
MSEHLLRKPWVFKFASLPATGNAIFIGRVRYLRKSLALLLLIIAAAWATPSASAQSVACARDTILYPYLKELTFTAPADSFFTDAMVGNMRTASQAYHLNSPVKVVGVQFWGAAYTTSATYRQSMPVKVYLYEVDAQNMPIKAIDSTIVNITESYEFYEALFSDPKSVDKNFAVGVKSHLNDTLAVITNNAGNVWSRNYGEGLAWRRFGSGTWNSSLSFFGQDLEYMIFPIVEYGQVAASFTTDGEATPGVEESFTNTSPSAALLSNRMFNLHAFDKFWATGTGDGTYVWKYGDGTEEKQENGAHTFTSPGTRTVELTAELNGYYTVCKGTYTADVVVAAPVEAPSAPNLVAVSDSGVRDDDDITNDTTPTFSGTAEPGVTVKLFAGATEVGSVLADATTGAWEITSSALAEGSYLITAKAVDGEGNTSSASAGINVKIDVTAPVVNPVRLLSSNSSAGKAKDGDVVTLSFTVNEEVTTPEVAIAGQQSIATVGTTATLYQASHTVVSQNAEGAIPFSIKVEDLAGNTATAVTATTDNSGVEIDRTAPQLTSVTIASNNASSAKAKLGDVVTVRITANEQVFAPVVTIAGQQINGVPATTNSTTEFVSSYTVEATTQEGEVPFSILFKDLAGNEGTTVTATSNNSMVVVDKTPPVLSVTIASNNTASTRAKVGDVVTVSITANEPIATPQVNILGRAATVVPATTGSVTGFTASTTVAAGDQEGVVPFSIVATDIVGNQGAGVTASTNGSTVTVDKTAPQLTLVSIISSNTATGRAKAGDVVTITFTANEEIKTPAVTVAGNPAMSVSGPVNGTYTATYTLKSTDSEGPVSFSIGFSDIAGNAATAVTTTTNGNSVVLDRTAPTGYGVAFKEAQVTVNNSTSIALNVTGAEVGASYAYSVTSANGGTPVTGSGVVTAATFTLSGLNVNGLNDGQLTATLSLTDVTGNRGADATAQVLKYKNAMNFTRPAMVQVPIRTAFAQVPKPATVAVTFSNGTTEQVSVAWQQGSYNGLIAGDYEITGNLTAPAGSTNLSNLQAKMTVRVMPNQAPTNITLSRTTFQPSIGLNEAIGVLTAVDADDPVDGQPENQHLFELVAGTGSTDNALFEIDGNQLFLKSNKGLSGKTSFSIRVRALDPYNNSFEKALTLNKEAYAKTKVEELKIVNGFSPNGDGINDTWIVPELRFYNDVEIQVFDRSGVELFRTTNPEQGWDGRNKDGKVLAGAYLYTIQVKDTGLVQKGTVTIIKK